MVFGRHDSSPHISENHNQDETVNTTTGMPALIRLSYLQPRDPDRQPNLCGADLECLSSFGERHKSTFTRVLRPATVDRLVPLWVQRRRAYASDVQGIPFVPGARSVQVVVAQQKMATRLVRVSVETVGRWELINTRSHPVRKNCLLNLSKSDDVVI
jgi:hypothetical protein